MKHRLHAVTVSLIALALVAPSAAFADRDKDKNKNRRQANSRSSQQHSHDIRFGHADGKTFRIPWENGGTGRAPVYNRNAPINQRNNRWDDRYNQNRWDDRYNNSYRQRESDRRQQTKNEWRNIGIGSGLVALLGLLTNDSRVTFAGAAGALYSAYRYEQDRKSQNRVDRARADLFAQDHFYRDGRRYDRKTVYKNGQKYYQFVCNR